MKSGKILVFLLLSLSFLISACQDNNKKDDYSGMSELIAERNRARFDVAKNSPTPKKTSPRETIIKKTSPSISKDDVLSVTILYEQDVKIVGSNSGRTIADGVAYINKKGQIVRIKIIKE